MDHTRTAPRPPDDLGDSGRALWAEVHETWELGSHETRLLLEACRTADELDMIREAIRSGPATVEGSKGQPRPSPLWEEARRHREQLTRLLVALRLPDDTASAPPSAASLRAQHAAQARWGAEKDKRARSAQARRRG